MRPFVRALSLGLVVAVAPSVQAQVVNGSFESCPPYANLNVSGSTAIPGWVTTYEGVEWFTPTNGVAYSGSCAVDLAVFTSNGNPGGGIAQTIALTTGSAYSISFAGTTFVGSGRDGTGVIELWLNGTFANSWSVSNPSATITASDWQTFNHGFIASGSTTVEFRNQQNALQHFAYIDGVSVTPDVLPTPEPASILLVASGLVGLVLIGYRRR